MIADAKPRQTKYNKTGRKEVWLMVETSVPLILNDELYFSRILYHVVEDRKYLDLRKWKDVSTEHANRYEPMETGTLVPVEDGFKLFEVCFKQLVKHKETE